MITKFNCIILKNVHSLTNKKKMINYNITNYIAKNLEYRICVFLATFYLKVGKIDREHS